MAVELRCAVRGFTDRTWFLDVSGPHAVVTTADGQPFCKFTPEEASARFLVPHFGSKIDKFTICLDEQSVPFKVSKQGLKEIKSFLLRSVATQGSEAIDEFKSRAGKCMLIGLGSIVLGAVLSIGSYMAAASQPEGGSYWVFTGLIGYGIYSLVRGFALSSQGRKIEQLAEQRA